MTIEIFDDVFAEHDAQIIHDMITNDNFLWHYYHKSENGTDVYHWHRLAGHNEKELIENVKSKEEEEEKSAQLLRNSRRKRTQNAQQTTYERLWRSHS